MTVDAVGGVWQYALDLAHGLRPRRVEIVIAVLGPAPSAGERKSAEAAGVTLITTDLSLDWTAGTAEKVEEGGWAIARMATELAPDVIHLNHPAFAASAQFPAPVVAVAHSCVATWWQAVRSGPLPAEFVWRSDLVRRGYHIADAVTAPTAAFAAATARAYDLPQVPIVIRNGRQPRRRVPSTPERSVLTAGRLWDEGKNVAALDRAAARLSVPVLAAGALEGPNGARIALQHLQALGRLDQDEMARRLSRRPVFVSAARYEPFGLAVLEAAQAGCALVLADIPTFRELWDGAAVFIPPDDDEAIASAVERLLRDPETRSRLGHLAQDRSEVYSVEEMAAGVLAVYRSLAGVPADASAVEEAAA
jgi:glycosyltransferase involved in cell wall biosynthesis